MSLSNPTAGEISGTALATIRNEDWPAILFVDDDLGAAFEGYFQNALQVNGFGFNTWDVSVAGLPNSADLSPYQAVIWNTGYAYSGTGAGLSASEQLTIQTYLNSGGRIFISGQDILYNGVDAAFRQNYLKIGNFANDLVTTAHTEAGLSGNPISEGMSLSISSPAGYVSLYVDGVSPTTDAQGLFALPGTPANPYSAVSYRGNYSLGGFGMVFMTVPFESISTSAAAPNNQTTVMKRIVDFLLPADTANGVVVVSNPAPSASTTENGVAVTFTVRLNSQPTSNVTIPLSSGDTTEGTVGPSTLTFTPVNWNVAQTVTVTGIDDAVDDGDMGYSVILGVTSSSDTNYNGLNPADVALTNVDNDTAGITVSNLSGSTTTESGGTVTFTVQLNSQPTANVTIPISSSDTSEGTVSASSLTFTSANWNQPQTVTVTGVNDNIDDGDVGYVAVIGAASSSDGKYNSLNPADINLTNLDDTDTAGISVSSPSGSTTTEAGGTVTFTVQLDSQPTANVTIPISSSDTSEGTVSASSLTFTSANWNQPQTVTVTGVNDNIDDGDVGYVAVIGAASSSDGKYNSLNPADINLTNLDDTDTAGISVSSPSDSTTTEAGGTVTFTVQLDSQPTANVTIPISSSDTSEGTVSASSLTFTSANWNQPQTVTGVDDSVVDGDVNYTIVIGAADSSDVSYIALNPADINLTNQDDDVPGVVVANLSRTTTTEAGGMATFTVVLQVAPAANVTIPLSSSDTTEGTVGPSTLTFTPVNWNVAQTVTVTGIDDAVDDGDMGYSVILGVTSSSDTNYNGLNPADVALTNVDDDTAGITVSNLSGSTTMESGGTVTFTVQLNSQPTANVTIPISSSDTSEGTVSASSLIFTSANWNQPQTVTVTGQDDALNDGDVTYAVLIGPASSADGTYDNVNPGDISLTNQDNEPPQVELFYDGFEVAEWNGLWVEDSQNDWFRSTQRATDGVRSAEVDGLATNATLTLVNAIDTTPYSSVILTFDWFMESSFDPGEFLVLEVFRNGNWTEVIALDGGLSSDKDSWKSESRNLKDYGASVLVRFRSTVSGSAEDANVDNVRIVGVPGSPPAALGVIAGSDSSNSKSLSAPSHQSDIDYGLSSLGTPTAPDTHGLPDLEIQAAASARGTGQSPFATPAIAFSLAPSHVNLIDRLFGVDLDLFEELSVL